MKYKSISAIISKILLLTFLLIINNCAAGPAKGNKMTKIEKKYFEYVNTYQQQGSVAGIGRGSSKRTELASDKAIARARKAIAKSFEVRVQNLTKDFQEELGEDFDTEFNEAFSSATKIATDKNLKGTVPREQEFMEVKLENGQAGYKCYVVVAVDLNMLTQSFEDELKNKNKKLYERFRASEAFNELDEHFENNESQTQ